MLLLLVKDTAHVRKTCYGDSVIGYLRDGRADQRIPGDSLTAQTAHTAYTHFVAPCSFPTELLTCPPVCRSPHVGWTLFPCNTHIFIL